MHASCVVHVLHAIQVANPVFLALKRTFTGISYYFPLYLGPDRPCNMLNYPFSCCGSIETLLESQLLLLPTVTCVQSDHVPKSRAKMQKSQLWTLITFFGWVLLHHILAQFLYLCIIYHLSSVCSDIAQPKKSHFL